MKRKVGFVFVGFMILLLLLPFGSSFAEGGASDEFDSFAVKDEYREIASSANLLEKLKERTSFYEESIEYAVMYDNIIAEFRPSGSFKNELQDGEIRFEDADSWISPLLYIPIVDAATSQTVTYAITEKGETVRWLDLRGDVITKG